MFNIIRPTDHTSKLTAFAVLGLFAAGLAFGQAPATLSTDEQGDATENFERTAQSAADLDELVGPIALYPDDLIAIVLPASTFPLQIVQASRFLDELDADDTLKPDASWDDSIVALLNYPEALALLNDDLDRTWALGEAVISRQDDVLNAIQTFRDRAYAAGNLATDKHQVVATEDDGAITITPADPEVVYVPYYDPTRVVVHEYVPLHYYPYAYPTYYYPYPFGYSFGSRLFFGVTTAFAISWHHHYLHVHHHSHVGHPYFGHRYYRPWYARTDIHVNVNRIGGHDHWRAGRRHGNRPRHRANITRHRDRAVVNVPRKRAARTERLNSRSRNERNAGKPQARRASPGRAINDQRERRVRTDSRPKRNAVDHGQRRRNVQTVPSRNDNLERRRTTSEQRGTVRQRNVKKGDSRRAVIGQGRGHRNAQSQNRKRREVRSQDRSRSEARSQNRSRGEARSQGRSRSEARSQNRSRGEARSQGRSRSETRSQNRGRGKARSHRRSNRG